MWGRGHGGGGLDSVQGEVRAEREVSRVCIGQVRNSPWPGWRGQSSEGREAGRWVEVLGPLWGPALCSEPNPRSCGWMGRSGRAQGLP